MLERVRRYSLVRGLRGVEQTPETAFVAVAALQAYPPARGVHLVRDGRDVVCSLLEKGWLSAQRGGGDDAGLPYGARARFWVEPPPAGRVRGRERCDPGRVGLACLRHRRAPCRARVLELRYESLVGEPERASAAIAAPSRNRPTVFTGNLDRAHATAPIGRFHRESTPHQLADVEREAGTALARARLCVLTALSQELLRHVLRLEY